MNHEIQCWGNPYYEEYIPQGLFKKVVVGGWGYDWGLGCANELPCWGIGGAGDNSNTDPVGDA